MTRRVQWVRPLQDLLTGIGFGYSSASANLGRAVEAAGVEIADDAPVAIHVDYPLSFEPIPGKRNVLLTMFESRPLPQAFVPKLRQADAILVPSRFCLDLFRPHVPRSIPLLVSPLGFDPAVFYPPAEPRSWDLDRWQLGDPVLRYLWVGSPSRRKGWMQTTASWSWFLKGEPWCELLFKTTDENSEGAVRQVSPNVWINTTTLPWDRLAELYQSAHVFVMPSLGEGWGLTPLEAMACACPTIVCKFGGVLDFATERTAFFAPFHLATDDDAPLAPAEGSYANLGGLAKTMLKVARDYERVAVPRGLRAAEFVRANFTWAKVAQRFIENLDRLGWGK